MKYFLSLVVLVTAYTVSLSQDLTEGLLINDLSDRPMQDLEKPDLLDSYIDPSFGTTIRRISDVGDGGVIKPMYSTVQAWNADESLMILYEVGRGHRLHDGTSYEFKNYLDEVNPTDLEDLFWSFDDPEILFYVDRPTRELIEYNVVSGDKTVLADLLALTGCTSNLSLGNDVQMMGRDGDQIGLRCGNTNTYVLTISTGELLELAVSNVNWVAPSIGPSGDYYLHRRSVYDSNGDFVVDINANGSEHSSMGVLSNGNDAHFAISFDGGPLGDCLAEIVAHDLTTGECFEITGDGNGYGYPKSGTHLSALAHNNDIGGWVAASMMGYERDGQTLLDQEIIVTNSDPNNLQVMRVAHHRSDEDEFDYWGEPHVSMSPSGTRLVFGSDWSGDEDGLSVDAYVVELPSYLGVALPIQLESFNAYYLPSQEVELAWKTASETELQGFVVEHLRMGYWDDLQKVDGRGTEHVGAQYSFVISDILPGANSYRLRILDLDGTYSYSPIIEVYADIPIYEDLVSIYPNPAKGKTTLLISPASGGPMSIDLIDSLGKRVRTVLINEIRSGIQSSIEVDLVGLSPGMYYLSSKGNYHGQLVVSR